MHQMLSALSSNYILTNPFLSPSITSTPTQAITASLLNYSCTTNRLPCCRLCSPRINLPTATQTHLFKTEIESGYSPAQTPSAACVTLGIPSKRLSMVCDPQWPGPATSAPSVPPIILSILHLLPRRASAFAAPTGWNALPQNNARGLLPNFIQVSVQTPRAPRAFPDHTIALPPPHRTYHYLTLFSFMYLSDTSLEHGHFVYFSSTHNSAQHAGNVQGHYSWLQGGARWTVHTNYPGQWPGLAMRRR